MTIDHRVSYPAVGAHMTQPGDDPDITALEVALMPLKALDHPRIEARIILARLAAAGWTLTRKDVSE